MNVPNIYDCVSNVTTECHILFDLSNYYNGTGLNYYGIHGVEFCMIIWVYNLSLTELVLCVLVPY